MLRVRCLWVVANCCMCVYGVVVNALVALYLSNVAYECDVYKKINFISFIVWNITINNWNGCTCKYVTVSTVRTYFNRSRIKESTYLFYRLLPNMIKTLAFKYPISIAQRTLLTLQENAYLATVCMKEIHMAITYNQLRLFCTLCGLWLHDW